MEYDQQSYQRIIASLPAGLYIIDRERNITFWNQAAEKISGFAAAEVVGSCCANNILTHIDGEGNRLCQERCPMALTLADGRPRETEVYLHHRDGHRVPVAVRINAMTDESGAIVGAVQLFTEIGSQGANHLLLPEAEKPALLDKLTHLANREYLDKELQNRIAEKYRVGGNFGILYLDIDLFREFNESHGHLQGDKILQGVAATMLANSRPFDLYGRWGGEEFIGIVRNCGEAVLKATGNRLRLLVENTYIMQAEEELRVTVSLGATMFRGSDTSESLIRRAATLMDESRRAGGNRLTLS